MSSLFGETDDDVTLRTRRGEDHRGSDMDGPHADREVTLNTGTVLALFFTLALICAVFFGFGYSMGRKSTQPAAAGVSDSPAPASGNDTAGSESVSSKPAPGSPAIQPIPGYMSQSEANTANEKAGAQSNKSLDNPKPAQSVGPPVIRKPVVETPAPAPVVRTPPPAPPAPVVAYNSAPAAVATGGATYVQIAAVSHQEDANVLLSALQRRGYKVLARSDTGDKLIHVQIGPFADRKQAEATRQKLLGDGYNAFLK